MLADAFDGYCAVTTKGGGSCAHGHSGSWSDALNLTACTLRCAACARCRYVSFSHALSDCSWYAHCELSHLQQKPSGFKTLHVPDGRLPVAPEPSWRDAPPARGAQAGAKRGYCSTTLHRGDCMLGDAGILEGVATLRTCRQRCVDCPRCAFVSWSARRRDCSWYAVCALTDLRRPPRDAPDYVSVRVRDAPAALPPPPQQPRTAAGGPLPSSSSTTRPLSIAIATLAADLSSRRRKKHAAEATAANDAAAADIGDGGDDSPAAIGCALVLWCERAERLRRALHSGLGWNASLILIGASAAAAAHCPSRHTRRLPVDPALTQALRAASSAERRCAASTDVNMLKLSVMGYGEGDVDLILFADIDIDLMPSNDLTAASVRWGAMAPILLEQRSVRFVANADSMSPVNGGLWLVKPSRQMLANMLRSLRRCSWNASHGWELAGPPRSLGLAPRHLDGARLSTDVGDVPERSDAYRRNDWRFVGGNVDQGFLWHWFFVRKSRGRYFRYAPNRNHLILHWRAWPKPWAIGWKGGFRAAAAAAGDSGGSAGGAADWSEAAAVGRLQPWELSYAYTYMRDLHLELGAPAAAAAAPAASRPGTCVRELWAFRRAIEDDERFDELPPTLLGQSVPYFALW